MADRADLDLGPLLGDDGTPSAEHLVVGSSDLTTHGVVVGMTGSGKTGLAIVLIEEALAGGIPVLALDPKGDLGNLALVFPDLAPASFRPWISEADAQAAGLDADAYAAKVAADWSQGLASSGIGSERLQALRDAADVTIYTPGSTAGTPLDVIGSLQAPALSWETDEEALRDEIQGAVSGLLGLVGIDADPLASREHVLLANIVETAWRAGRDLDLGTLIGEVQTPPFRRLGVFDVDQFFPPKERTALAFRLNALAAAPGFAAWGQGASLDPQTLLFHPDGRPRCAIVYLAHLSDAERQLVVTRVLSRLVTWMRTQPGSGDLRALAYMDEVFGYVPPTADPPAKRPILTLLKQGRAFGVGLVLATQNPVDLDYKAMANAGTWMVGRLQTENDKKRVLEALRSAAGDADLASLDRALGGLGKRQFLLVSAKASRPRLFTTRWAMSYLRGPLTKDDVARLRAASPEDGAPEGSPTPPVPSPAAEQSLPPAGATPALPAVARGVTVAYVDPAAPWAASVGAKPGGTVLRAALAFRCSLRYDDAKAKLDVLEEWEAIAPLEGPLDLERLVEVDYDDRDLRPDAPAGASYVLPQAAIGETAFFRDAARRLEHRLVTGRPLVVQANPELRLTARPDETAQEFAARCAAEAEARADAETAKLTDKLGVQRTRLERALRTAQERETRARDEASARTQRDLVAGAGQLLGSLLGGRRSSRGLARMAGALGPPAGSARADAAAAKAADARDDLAALEQQLAEGILEIDARWQAAAAAITPVEIPLEASDVRIVETRLVWIPCDR